MFDLTLSKVRSFKLAKETIHQAIEYEEKSFFVQGMCLYKIKEEGWWQSDYQTFALFCRREFDRGENWAYKQIEAYKAVADVVSLEVDFINEDGETDCTMVQIDNERQARELARLESETERANALRAAAASAKLVDGKPKITAAGIKKAAESNGTSPKKKKAAKNAEAQPTGQEWCKHQVNQIRAINKSIYEWKKKHAKGNANWEKAIEGMKMAHSAFVALGKLKS